MMSYEHTRHPRDRAEWFLLARTYISNQESTIKAMRSTLSRKSPNLFQRKNVIEQMCSLVAHPMDALSLAALFQKTIAANASLASSTKRVYFHHARSFFEWLGEPAAVALLRKVPVGKTKGHLRFSSMWLDFDFLKKFLDFGGNYGKQAWQAHRDSSIFCLAYDTTLPFSVILGLQREQVDPSQGIITIAINGHERVLPLCDLCKEKLRQYLDFHPPRRQYLFGGYTDSPMSQQALNSAFRKRCSVLGLSDTCNLQGLRYIKPARALLAGATPAEVANKYFIGESTAYQLLKWLVTQGYYHES